jgi:hypothetical protein
VRPIKRIETTDSTIIYGADKLRTQIVHVHRYMAVEKNNMAIYIRRETGYTKIAVIKGIKKIEW